MKKVTGSPAIYFVDLADAFLECLVAFNNLRISSQKRFETHVRFTLQIHDPPATREVT